MTGRVPLWIAGGGAVGLAVAVILVLLMSRCAPQLMGAAGVHSSPSPIRASESPGSPAPTLSPFPSDQPTPSPSSSPSPGAPLTIADASLHAGDQNFAYTPKQLVATGGTQPYTWSVSSGALPPGLTLLSGGVVSGTPTSTGAYPLTLNVADTAGSAASIGMTVSISSPLVVNGTCAAKPCLVEVGCTDVCGTYAIQQGGSSPYQYSLVSGTLPPNTQLNGLSLSGQFTTASDPKNPSTFTVLVTDAAGMTAGTGASFSVQPPLSFGKATLPVANRGSPYSGSIAIQGGIGPASLVSAINGLPPNLTASVSGNSVLISGQVARGDRSTTYSFTVTIMDQGICGPTTNDHCTTTNTYQIAVN